ncbi:hypothetical protein BGZ73_005391 [Actinomortierella ambigua]|nr:hypothetical protein BGZ73_005391 [Actinomortierella ambigua]
MPYSTDPRHDQPHIAATTPLDNPAPPSQAASASHQTSSDALSGTISPDASAAGATSTNTNPAAPFSAASPSSSADITAQIPSTSSTSSSATAVSKPPTSTTNAPSSGTTPTLHSRRRRATLQGQQPTIITNATHAGHPSSTASGAAVGPGTGAGTGAHRQDNVLIDLPEQTPANAPAPLELDPVKAPSGGPSATTSGVPPSNTTATTDAYHYHPPPTATSETFKEMTPPTRSSTMAHETAPTPPSFMQRVRNRILRLRGRTVSSKKNARVIPINPTRTTPLIQPETGKPFISNSVTTARYSFWDFLPKQLYAQFSKIANVYFLFVASLQMVPSWSPTGQYTTLVPLLTFLSIAIAHEGYDDYRRHRQDNVENNQMANVLRVYRDATNQVEPPSQDTSSRGSGNNNNSNNSNRNNKSKTPPDSSSTVIVPMTPSAPSAPTLTMFQKIKWKDVAVGNIIRVDQNEWVPADLILLYSAGHEGSCYIETAALDGETNLKQRQALKVTNDMIHSPEDLVHLRGCANTEQPNQDLYNFDGFMDVDHPTPLSTGETTTRHALSISQILLRGTILRNTPYIYGLVVFSGEDTKIRQNSSKNIRTKAPSMQRLINKVIIIIFSIVLILSAVCTVLSKVWKSRNERRGRHAWYLSEGQDMASIFFGYIVLFNTMIPISLYVTMELVKLVQAYFIQQDIEMYDPVSNTPAEARTTVINEELGQVSYLFSDKTGTLTENIMMFRKFCVAGHSFHHDLDPESIAKAKRVAEEDEAMMNLGSKGSWNDMHQQQPSSDQSPKNKKDRKAKKGASKVVQRFASRSSPSQHSRRRQNSSAGYQSLDEEMNEMEEARSTKVKKHYPDSICASENRRGASGGGGDYNKLVYAEDIVPCTPTSQLVPFLRSGTKHPMQERIRFFLLAMALCHDAVPELADENDPDSLQYQAASPDENALVAGAKELGYVFFERCRGGIRVRSLGDNMASGDTGAGAGAGAGASQKEGDYYEILNVIEFSSKRKRMSVIYRMPNGQICLFCKGADSIILERVRDPKIDYDYAQSALNSPPYTPLTPRRFDTKGDAFGLERSGAGAGYGVGASSGPASAGVGVGSGTDYERSARRRQQHDRYGSNDSMAQPMKSPLLPKDLSLGHVVEEPLLNEMDDLGSYFFGHQPGWVQSEMWEYQQTMDHIQEYAATGLRTLLYGHRYLSKEEYQLWAKQYADAQSALENRQEKLEAVAELLEQGLDMTGATAIEDKLQEGVPEAIDKLRRAGIRLWMLTGDKRETAINIGYSCRLIKDYSSTIILDVPTQAQAHKAINKALRDVNKGKSRHVVVVIDGATLGIVEQTPELMALFVELGIRADSVICCRVSPAQKALVVKTVRANCKHAVTLAIGDGANDIAMIQEANVGIGITGKEGLQAARSSDYSIAQFRFLERLLFVHGRWSYVRISKFVLGTFYKCATFYLTQGAFQLWTGFSGTSLYEQWTLSFYNTLFSSLPVMVVGMFEQDLKASTLLLVPELYTFGPRDRGFSVLTYATWMLAAVFQAIATLLVPLWINGAISQFGIEADDGSLFNLGLNVYTTIVLVVTFKVAYLETHNWSIMTHITSVLTIVAWFGYNTMYSFFYPVKTAGYHVRGVFQAMAGHLPFWMTVFVSFMVAIIPNVIAKIAKAQMFPTDVDVYQELEKDPEAVQRWKEWEMELGTQGAEAEGVTGAKIKRRLSIAASIVSRQSSMNKQHPPPSRPHSRKSMARSHRGWGSRQSSFSGQTPSISHSQQPSSKGMLMDDDMSAGTGACASGRQISNGGGGGVLKRNSHHQHSASQGAQPLSGSLQDMDWAMAAEEEGLSSSHKPASSGGLMGGIRNLRRASSVGHPMANTLSPSSSATATSSSAHPMETFAPLSRQTTAPATNHTSPFSP